ncbi:MAG: NADH-quinone oxidoreductase subunit NuoG [Actinobacteria bacterium]|nr:NADH-quinone oxidoreductase subunit NuoG [Actinomycetota bacterium]
MTTDDDVQQAVVDPNEVRLKINGREVISTKGEMVIAAARKAGEYIPHFCYHERMNPVGMCRMCLVDVDTGRGPMLQPSCMVPVVAGMAVETESANARQAQEGILELLLANHPLDCPVCDKGGECPLQDQAFSHGPGESRYLEEKRHFAKPIAISDLVYLDRERCILCDRCTRFADEVAGDALISFTNRGNQTYIDTFPDEPFSSYFSGNTVQICPVGALTAKPYRFKARPWDLSQQESTCTTCAVGCRIVVESSRDEVLRYMGVDSDPVNHGWLCDRGRFNFESAKSSDRILEPLVRDDGKLRPASWSVALSKAAAMIVAAKAAGGAESVAIIGGARGTNEDVYAWSRLAHEVIGTPNVYPQIGDGLPSDVLLLDRATIDEAASATTIVLLGPDLKEELPVLYLRLRAAAESKRSRIIEFTPKQSGLTRYAWRSIGYEPGSQVAAIDNALADPAVAAQLAKGSVVVVFGRTNLAETTTAGVQALHRLLAAAPGSKVLPAFRRGNSVGALQIGMRTGAAGLTTRETLQAAADGKIDCLVLVGADPLADFADTDLARRGMAGARRIIAVDAFLSASAAKADIVLAASVFGEKVGTTTNIEGRVTNVVRQVSPAGSTRPDWMIAAGLAEALGADLDYAIVADVTADIAVNVPGFETVTAAAIAASPNGVLAGPPRAIAPASLPDSAAPERNSYELRLVVSRTMYDQAAGTTHSPSLANLSRGSAVHLHPLDLARVGTADGVEVKVISKRATVVLRAVGDPAVMRGTAWLPWNNPGPNVGELIDCFAAVNDVRIENL